MSIDKAFANSNLSWIPEGGNIGKGMVEHINFIKLRISH